MKKEKTFEEAMDRLSEVVEQMEAGELPLDETVKLYQEGIALAAFCSKTLQDAEQSIQMLEEQEESHGKDTLSGTDA